MKLTWFSGLCGLVMISCFDVQSQTLQSNAWNNFEGNLGNSEMQLSIYLFKDDSVKGNYFLKYTGPKIQLIGQEKAKTIRLREMIRNSPWGSFNGRLIDSSNSFTGTWTDSGASQTLAFNLKLMSKTAGSYEQHYPDLYGSTEDVESFMKKVVSAILINDKDWLGDHMRYPLKHTPIKGFNSINNKQQLIRYFDLIFTKNYKEKIRQAYTTNLFTKNGSVMLGNGEIWIGNTSNSTKDKHALEIIAVNP